MVEPIPSVVLTLTRSWMSMGSSWRIGLLRVYVLIVGAALILLGLIGLASSEGVMAAIQTSPVTDLFHLFIGIFFLSIGLWQRDPVIIRQLVGGLGVLFLLAMGLIILAPLLWGGALLANILEITGVLIGSFGILAARDTCRTVHRRRLKRCWRLLTAEENRDS